MKLFYFCYHANYQTHAGEFWTWSRDRIQEIILKEHPNATDIHIWLA